VYKGEETEGIDEPTREEIVYLDRVEILKAKDESSKSCRLMTL
jgi:hypothetical protein